jgi:hypothetical protein
MIAMFRLGPIFPVVLIQSQMLHSCPNFPSKIKTFTVACSGRCMETTNWHGLDRFPNQFGTEHS